MQDHRAAKDALYDGFAGVAKALGSGRRAELVDVLAQGERHVDELADEIGQSVANTSHHLRALAAAGLVTTRRRAGTVVAPGSQSTDVALGRSAADYAERAVRAGLSESAAVDLVRAALREARA